MGSSTMGSLMTVSGSPLRRIESRKNAVFSSPFGQIAAGTFSYRTTAIFISVEISEHCDSFCFIFKYTLGFPGLVKTKFGIYPRNMVFNCHRSVCVGDFAGKNTGTIRAGGGVKMNTRRDFHVFKGTYGHIIGEKCKLKCVCCGTDITAMCVPMFKTCNVNLWLNIYFTQRLDRSRDSLGIADRSQFRNKNGNMAVSGWVCVFPVIWGSPSVFPRDFTDTRCGFFADFRADREYFGNG